VNVTRAGADRIAELQSLWEALELHHAELPDVPSIRPLADSWERRRERYRGWLESGDGRLFVAEVKGHVVGYLMLTITHTSDSWDVGSQAAEIETLSVLAEARSSGVGAALLDAALQEATAAGVNAIGVGVVHSNVDAVRFYERAGFKPFYVELLRLADDVRPRDDPRRRRRGLRALLRNRSRLDRDR
jgi:ribosomal protein S18 acetylase RimI-like enzyme